jgi:hypothetical protein
MKEHNDDNFRDLLQFGNVQFIPDIPKMGLTLTHPSGAVPQVVPQRSHYDPVTGELIWKPGNHDYDAFRRQLCGILIEANENLAKYRTP